MLLIRAIVFALLISSLGFLNVDCKKTEALKKFAKNKVQQANEWIRKPTIKTPNVRNYFRTNPRVLKQIKADYN